MRRAFQRGYNRHFHYLNRPQLRQLAKLRSLVRRRRGCALVTGPGGTGKTTLLKRIAEECRAQNALVIDFLAAPQSFEMLIEALLTQVAPGMSLPTSQVLCLQVLQNELLKCQARDRPIICIDEAQTAPDEVLLGLFQVAGIDSASGSVRVPLVLAGTDDIAERLTCLLGRPLEQIISMTFPLASLTGDAVEDFIRHQLAAAEIKQRDLFHASAIDKIAVLSRGVQSEINSLCGLSMHLAGLEESKRVTADIVNRVSRDFWISPIERASVDSVSAGQVSDGVIQPPDHDGAAANDDFDLGRAEKSEAERQTEVASDLCTPAGGRSHSRKTWGWMALVIALVTGPLSYTLRHDLPGEFSWDFAWMTRNVENTAANSRSGGLNPLQTGSETNILATKLELSAPQPESADVRSEEDFGVSQSESSVQVQPGKSVTRMQVSESIYEVQALDDRIANGESVVRTGHHALALNEPAQLIDPASVLPPAAVAGTGAQQPRDSAQAASPHAVFGDHIPVIDPATLHKRGFSGVPPQTGMRSRPIGLLDGQATVRTRPSTQAPSLEILGPGDRATITARVDRSHWLQVVVKSGELGYVYAELASVAGGRSSLSASSEDLEMRLIPREESEATLREVPRLLQVAGRHLEADRLFAPRFDNALYVYREVLRIDPGNVDAEQGIRNIKTKLTGHSQNAQARGDLAAAKHALNKVLLIDAADQEALQLLSQLQGEP